MKKIIAILLILLSLFLFYGCAQESGVSGDQEGQEYPDQEGGQENKGTLSPPAFPEG